MVEVSDQRFEELCRVYEPRCRVPAVVQVTDIAGLVRGAHEGHGLGNEFLSHIQQVDALIHVVRGFQDAKILHTEGHMDVLRDIEIINNELIQKDKQLLNKKLADVRKKHQRNPRDTVVKGQYECLLKVEEQLGEGLRVGVKEWTVSEAHVLNTLLFITSKPMLYLVNLSVDQFLQHVQGELLQWKAEVENKVH